MLKQLRPTARASVAVRNHGCRPRPSDSHVRVIESDGDVLARLVSPVDPVTDVGSGRKSLESVQKTSRDVEMMKFSVIEKKGAMLAESRRSPADVDDDVVDGTVRAADQLCLADAGAAVHSTDHPLDRSGLRVLHEYSRSPRHADEFIEDGGVKCSGEQTAVIMHRLRHENRDTCKVGTLNSHPMMLP